MLNRFFCSVNFGRSIYSPYRIKSGIIKACQDSNLNHYFHFRFFRKSNGGIMICEPWSNFHSLVPIFWWFCINFDQFSLKYDKILKSSLNSFQFKDRGSWWIFEPNASAKFSAKFLKIRHFFFLFFIKNDIINASFVHLSSLINDADK